MRLLYRPHRIHHLKKELKEIYANQVIESLGLFMIGIFIPAYLIESGFGFLASVSFIIMQWAVAALFSTVAAKLDGEIGVKHTVLARVPVVVAYLIMVMSIGQYPGLYLPALVLGGLSLSMYWVSMNTEYVRSSDRNDEGEEAGMYVGLPYATAVVGPLAGAGVLTIFGFDWLFSIAVALIFLSVAPLFLSNDHKGDIFSVKRVELMIDRRRALLYVTMGVIYTTDFVLWSLYVFLNYGYLSLGLAASLVGMGMIIYTMFVGRLSNTIKGRTKVTRIAGFLSVILWLLRLAADSQLEFMLLSLAGGFIISTFWISLYADFAMFAKKNQVCRCVVFRNIWINIGHSIPVFLLLLAAGYAGMGTVESIRAAFVLAAAFSLTMLFFRR